MTSLYAEFLPNIRTLTVTTVLETPRDQSTALWLTNNHSKLVLEHGDDGQRVSLPAKVPGEGSQHLQLPNTGELQCVNRIPAGPLFTSEEVIVPWTASTLGSNTELGCKHCNALISSGNIKVWKDLPSEAWAEMMDLWHCHKPAESDHSHDGAPAQKGYAAGNKLVAKAGTGFVDVMSFLLSEEDCNGIEIRPSGADNTAPSVQCTSCNSPLGFHDMQAHGLRVQKLDLSLSTPTQPARSFTSEQWFSCHLLSAIETQGVRKFIFTSLPYEIWVFSTNLAYSSLECPEPRQAIKVLYREREGTGDVETLRASNLLIETLTLTPRLEGMLLECLQKQNGLLPESLRNFVGWNVAVLPMFTSEDSS